MYESDYKISVKGLTNDKQCFIIFNKGVTLLFLRRSADMNEGCNVRLLAAVSAQ